MERVGFLIEESGERLGCLLNPETLEICRRTGLRPRRSGGGALTGRGLREDPLLYTGGGTTELKLDLLFDTSLSGSSIPGEDVRHLTAPLWRLSENEVTQEGYGRLPTIQFIWGKSWNIPCVIAGIAERFESFTSEGVPRRSWIRLRLVRTEGLMDGFFEGAGERSSGAGSELLETPVHQVIGGQDDSEQGEGGGGERLDELADRIYGDCSEWRRLAGASGIDDPLRLPAGLLLKVPPGPGGEPL